MAQDQLTGTAHSADLIAFINDAVKWQDGMMCGGGTYHSNTAGWYLKLYLSPNYGIDENPAVVADVHTQPTDAAGNDVGRILHVGTGTPRLMVVTADTCQGPRAYVGLATSYGELIEENWKRLNDNDWRTIIATSGVPDVPWISSIISQ